MCIMLEDTVRDRLLLRLTVISLQPDNSSRGASQVVKQHERADLEGLSGNNLAIGSSLNHDLKHLSAQLFSHGCTHCCSHPLRLLSAYMSSTSQHEVLQIVAITQPMSGILGRCAL